MVRRNFVFLLFTLVVVILGFFSSFLLPEKYFFDAWVIFLDRWNEKGLVGSYSFSMLFYDITSLNKLPFPIIALIQLPVIFFLIKKLKIPPVFGRPVLRNVPVYLTILIFSVYLAMPSKEFINFIYVFFIVVIIQKEISISKKIIYSSVLFLVFGAFFRPYFALIPFIAFGLYLASFIKIKSKILLNIFSGILMACFISLSYGLIKGEFMSQSSREVLNAKRIGRSDSQTIIVSPVKTDNFIGESVGIFYGFISVNLPVNGLKFFYKPQVVAFVIWQVMMFLFLAYFYNKCLKNRMLYSHEQWIFHFLFAYLIVQGVFEPDLGSAVKHKLGVFPLIWLAFYYDQGLIKKPKIDKKYVFRITK
jgi:hypothetical protein